MSVPGPVFFSGGTALKSLSQFFAGRRFPSVHLVTTFDSGGSSATLRKAFAMPAVGDLRNRLLALADPEKAPPAAITLFNTRVPKNADFSTARQMLEELVQNSMSMEGLPGDLRAIVAHSLTYFMENVPDSFDARGASIGNLILTAAYLENNRDFEAALALYAPFFHICGVIVPIVSASLNLGAILKNGQAIVGQHFFAKLPAPVKKLFLTVHESTAGLEPAMEPVFCRPPATVMARDYLKNAGLICYSMGSFYSSLLANLLPKGIGQSVALSRAAKIYIPNSGEDPELRNMPLAEQVALILATLREDAPDARVPDLLNYVLVDSEHGKYPGSLDSSLASIRDLGIGVLDRCVVRMDMPRSHEPEAIFGTLGEILSKGVAS